MRRALLAALALTVASCTSAPKQRTPAQLPRSVLRDRAILNLSTGYRRLQDSGWEPAEQQQSLGLDLTLKNFQGYRESWLGVNIGLSGGRERLVRWATDGGGGGGEDSWQLEMTLGPRIFVPIPGTPVYAYGGFSGAMAYGVKETDLVPDYSEFFFAGVTSAGLVVKIDDDSGIGLEWRSLISESLPSNGFEPNDADSQQVALTYSVAF
jgi:hypothetical protein